MKRNTIIFIFLISGMAGLVYEVVWVRMLTLIFGTTTYAVSTVLFSFMAGLALGSYFFGKKIDSVRSPLLIYALLELGIGIYALFVPNIIEATNIAYISIFDENIPNFFTYSLLRFSFVMLVLLLPTTLMGGTLPVLSRYFVRHLDTIGWDVGILYTINTLGAVLGALLAGFYLEATYGVRMSIYIASAANIAIGLTVLLIALRSKDKLSTNAPIKPLQKKIASTAGSQYINPRIILWVFAVSGFCALGYEVIWFRTLLLVLYNNTYVFTIMLVTFLAGLALGSYLISRVLDEKRNWAAILAYILIGIGIVAAVVVPLFIVYHNSSFLEIRGSLGGSFRNVTLLGFFLSALIMSVPTILMGLTLPIANKIYIDSIHKVGKKIGRLYAANTLGGVLGSFVVGFLLIPYIGIIKSSVALAALYVLAGLLIIHQLSDYSPSKRKIAYALGTVLVALALGSLTGTGRLSNFHVDMVKNATTVFYKEGASSTVSIVDKGNTRAAFVNGNIVVGSTSGALQTVRMLAHLPMLMHPDPQTAVVIGFGMGVTTYSVSLHNPERLDVVEIAEEVLDGSGFFENLNHGIANSNKINIIIEDGRNYLLRTRKTYSVITADPTHPILGSGNLYTQEYYKQSYDKLDGDGVMVQYLPLHLLGTREFNTLINTFASVFKHSSLWYSMTDLVIMGTRRPLNIDYAQLESDLRKPSINSDLKLSNLDTPTSLLGHFLLGEDEIRRFVTGAGLNTDDRPVVEFTGPKSIGINTRPLNIEALLPYLASISRYVDLSSLPQNEQHEVRAALDAADKSKKHILKGLMYNSRNEFKQAIYEYNSALRVRPSNPDARMLLRVVRSRMKRSLGY